MNDNPNDATSKVVLAHIEDAPETPLPIPGKTGDIFIRLLNIEPAKGMTVTINRLAPGARIPAHYHNNGAESHYVLEGDFIEAGQSFGPGAFFTHGRGVVHGPHETRDGCVIYTVQEAIVDPTPGGDPDFHIAG